MRWRVTSLLCTVMRKGRPARAISTVASSLVHARVIGGGGLAGSGGGGGAGGGRMRVGVRTRAEPRELELPESAAMLVALRGPGLEHDPLGLEQARMRLRGIDAVALVVVDVVRGAASESHEQPPAADVVDQSHLLGHPDRMVGRQ